MRRLDRVKYEMNEQNHTERATRPPLEYEHLIHHWLHSERSSTPTISEWRGGRWYGVNEVGSISPEELFQRGWEWHAPVKISKSRIRRPNLTREGYLTESRG